MQTDTTTVEIPLKARNRATIWPSNPTSEHIPWENQTWKRHMYPGDCSGTFYNSWDMEAAYLWMDTEIVVHIYNRLLLNFKKECIWVSLNEVDEPRAYCTEWNKSERERQIMYINMCVWNLERWYWWTYFQGGNGDSDIENRLVDTVWEGDGGTNRESSMEIYTLPYVN